MQRTAKVKGRESYKNNSLSNAYESPKRSSARDKWNRSSQEDFNESDTLEKSIDTHIVSKSKDFNSSKSLNVSDSNLLQREKSLLKESTESDDEESEYEEEENVILEGNTPTPLKIPESCETNGMNNFLSNIPLIILILILGLIVGIASKYSFKESKLDYTSLRNCFPHLNNETWSALETGIEEVNKFNKPSVLFYLYKPESKTQTDKYINEISTYASTKLSLTANPIILKPSDFNTPSAKRDYGFIINHYREPLITNRVMVVKNVDEIDGYVAQAFHTLCDEFSPLVPKSLFMFTMNVADFGMKTSDFKFVEAVLKEKWGLDDDIFYPLLTRITNIILRID